MKNIPTLTISLLCGALIGSLSAANLITNGDFTGLTNSSTGAWLFEDLGARNPAQNPEVSTMPSSGASSPGPEIAATYGTVGVFRGTNFGSIRVMSQNLSTYNTGFTTQTAGSFELSFDAGWFVNRAVVDGERIGTGLLFVLVDYNALKDDGVLDILASQAFIYGERTDNPGNNWGAYTADYPDQTFTLSYDNLSQPADRDLGLLIAAEGSGANGLPPFGDDLARSDIRVWIDNVSLTVVPEPSVAILSLGALSLLGLRRRRA